MSPGLTVVLVHPFASIRLIAGPPTNHFSILPSSVRTSRVIVGGGFPQTNSLTVPLTVTSWDKLTGHEWCADRGTAPWTSARMTNTGNSKHFIGRSFPLRILAVQASDHHTTLRPSYRLKASS